MKVTITLRILILTKSYKIHYLQQDDAEFMTNQRRAALEARIYLHTLMGIQLLRVRRC